MPIAVPIPIAEAMAIGEIDRMKQDDKLESDRYMAQIKTLGDFKMKEYLEDRKDDRTKKQASQQSKMIDQRQGEGKPPIDFENELDFGNLLKGL